MHNQKQHPIFGHSDCRIPILLVDVCVFNPNKSVEEDLTRHFKSHAMLADVAGCFFRVPHEQLTVVKEIDVHQANVYTLYIPFVKFLDVAAGRFCIAGRMTLLPNPVSFRRISSAEFRRPCSLPQLIFPANRRMITMQTNLSAMIAACTPAGGEMSGLTAHFLFGAKATPVQRHNPGQTLPHPKSAV